MELGLLNKCPFTDGTPQGWAMAQVSCRYWHN